MDLSIIVPLYNSETNIIRTLKSIENQKMNDMVFEIILINDGSTDEGPQIAETYLKNANIDHWQIIHQVNSGVSAARNEGIKKAKGQYIYFLDSDDTIDDEFMSTIQQFISKNSDIIFFRFDWIDETGKMLQSFVHEYETMESGLYQADTILLKILNKKTHIWTCSAIYARSLLIDNQLAFNTSLINGEDIHFIHRALNAATNLYYINQTLSFYIQNPHSISNTFNYRKFDSVHSLMALKNLNPNKKMQVLYDYLIVENFLFNLKQASILNLNAEPREIIENINHYDNQLLTMIKSSYYGYASKSLKNFIDIMLFTINPIVYIKLYRQRFLKSKEQD